MSAEVRRFGPFELDLRNAELRRDGGRVDASPKVIDALDVLTSRAGALVRHDELLALLWPGVHVTEASLKQLVHKVRQVLDDDAAAPRWIEAIPKRGYRFVGEVGSAVPTAAVADRLAELFGREDAVAALDAALRAARFVTLHGPPGIGKTALALRYAAARAGDLWDGQALVDLVPVPDRSALLRALAVALDVELAAGDPGPALGRVLARRGRFLLVVDNAEHLVADADLLAGLVAAAPDARVLVTSRIPCGVVGESVVAIGPLGPMPGIALLAARSGLDLRDEPGAPDLVGLLDGNPLALELAARQLPALSPRDLAGRLRAGAGTFDALNAAVQASWDIATDDDRAVLAQVAAFAGRFSLSDAERVLVPAGRVVERLQRLVAHSWLTLDAGRRFGVTQAVRAFLREHCDPGALERWGAALLEEIGRFDRPARNGERVAVDALYERIPELMELARRGDGVRVALALEAPLQFRGPLAMIEDLAGLALAKQPAGDDRADLLRMRGRVRRRLERLDEALADLDLAVATAVSDEVASRACRNLALVLAAAGRVSEADATARRAEALAPPAERAAALDVRASVLHWLGQPGHEELWQQALRECPPASLHLRMAILVNHGAAMQDAGRWEEALGRYLECADLARLLDHRSVLHAIATNLGNVAVHSGRASEAAAWHEQALDLARALGDARSERVTLGNLAACAVITGDLDAAEPRARALLEQALLATDRLHEAWARIHLAAVAWERGRLADAEAQLDAAIRAADPPAAWRHLDHAAALRCLVLAERDRPEQAMAELAGLAPRVRDRTDVATAALVDLVPAFVRLALERRGEVPDGPDPVAEALAAGGTARLLPAPNALRCLARAAGARPG